MDDLSQKPQNSPEKPAIVITEADLLPISPARAFSNEINAQYLLVRKGTYLDNPALDVERMRAGLREAWDWALANPKENGIFSNTSSDPEAQWMHRNSGEAALGMSGHTARGSMNIYLSKDILQELDQILNAAEMGFAYKFGNPARLSSNNRHDNVTFYFDYVPAPEVLEKLAKFAEKHARRPGGAEHWDDMLLGTNITVDDHTYKGFTLDLTGTVKSTHVKPMVDTLKNIDQALGEGLEIYLKRDLDPERDPYRLSSGMLQATIRALADHKISLSYDPKIIGFTFEFEKDSKTQKIFASGSRLESFDHISKIYDGVITASTIEALFLGTLPPANSSLASSFKKLRNGLTAQDFTKDMKIPADHPWNAKLEKFGEMNHAPNMALLLEFADLYRDELSISTTLNRAFAENMMKNGHYQAIPIKSMRYDSSDPSCTEIEVSEYHLVTIRGQKRLMFSSPNDLTEDLLYSLAIAYQEKVHGLKYPQIGPDKTTLSGSEADLELEMRGRAVLFSSSDFLTVSSGSLLRAMVKVDSPLFPEKNSTGGKWGIDTRTLFLQKMREAFGDRAREVSHQDPKYLEIVDFVNAQHTPLEDPQNNQLL